MGVINKRIGVIGGGQLGKMMILEAKKLGFTVVVLDPSHDFPARSVCDEYIVCHWDDPAGYIELAGKVDVITYEYEHLNTDVLERLEREGHTIYPSVSSLKTIQNKFSQKEALHENGIPVPRFVRVSGIKDIKTAADSGFGYPLMLKATMGGYDGKGNALIKSEGDVETAFSRLGGGERELMAEEYVEFEKEISILACRGIDGSKVIYPAAENIHADSILDTTVVPARIGKAAMERAAGMADRVMEVFEGVGTFCTEMFVTATGEVYVNEVAPRPHNSGHYTIEGCLASQFENHVRGIVGLPFGSVGLISPTVMVNLLGEADGPAELAGLEKAYLDPNVRVHFYGKRESKKGRKMGHFTVVGTTAESALERAERIRGILRVNP